MVTAFLIGRKLMFRTIGISKKAINVNFMAINMVMPGIVKLLKAMKLKQGNGFSSISKALDRMQRFGSMENRWVIMQVAEPHLR